MTDPEPEAARSGPAPSGRSCCACNCYNQARRRLRSRRSEQTDAAIASAMAIFGADIWEGPSGPYLQQVMPGWRSGMIWPELVCSLGVLTLVCASLAAATFVCWSGTAEIELDYTDCANATPAICHLSLRLAANLTAPVYLYYALHSAYFNHRKIQSWSLPQLMGLTTAGNLTRPCGGHAYRGGKEVLPCGALPNAIFNDTFQLLGPSDVRANGTEPQIFLSSEGIGWPSDSRGLYPALPAERLVGTVRPASWPAPVVRRYERPFADAEDLHVWLRTPAFSSFRKMRHRLLLPGDLGGGSYRLIIGYNYPVSVFGGSKRVIVAQKSAFGGKNLTLMLLPATASGCYLLLCVSALVKCYCRRRRRLV